jgi:hypothetical protein
MNASLARSKSPSDLQRFRDLMSISRKLMKSDASDKAGVYYQAAMDMVSARKIYFVQSA